MAHKAPGKHFRKGMNLIEITRMFPDDATAEAWFVKTRWPRGPACPHCCSTNVLSGANHATMPYRCREKGCRKRFSVRTGTVMQSSNLGYQICAMAIYLCLTNLNGVSSMKLHRDLNITQKSAWHLAHRIRKSLESRGGMFAGSVEVDETFMGGKRRNMSNGKRKTLEDRGAVGKVAVVGVKDRATKCGIARVSERTDKSTLQGFVVEHAVPGAKVYSDEAFAYEELPFENESVKHSIAEYVRGMVHTNGMKSFWSILKRAHKCTFHKIGPEASGAIRDSIRGTSQHTRPRHHCPNGFSRTQDGR